MTNIIVLFIIQVFQRMDLITLGFIILLFVVPGLCLACIINVCCCPDRDSEPIQISINMSEMSTKNVNQETSTSIYSNV